MRYKVATCCSFGPTSTSIFLGALFSCAGAIIISSVADNLICPGEELVYRCVSQSTSQRWQVRNEGDATLESVFRQGQPTGTVDIDGPYRFTLISSNINHFESTVSAVATSSMNNTVLECAAGSLRDTVTIKITGTPTSPLITQSFVQEYQNHFSTVTFTWDTPHDNSHVEYYQYQLINETGIFVDNSTSNTSVTVSGIPYNENITLIVLAHTCIGSSPPSVEEVYIVGCLQLDNLVQTNSSIFSQAPGTELEIVLLCNIMDKLIHITCTEDGRWKPNPKTVLCLTDPIHVMVSGTTPKTSDSTGTNLPVTQRDHFPLLNVVVPVTVGIASSVSMGLIIIFCTLKLYFGKKKAMIAELPSLSGTNHENNGPIYETIKEADEELQVKMANNDAYQDICLNKTNFQHWCVTDVTNKDTIRMQMENNHSYQTSTSPVIVNSEVFSSKQPCCYEMTLVHTLENTQRLNNMHASQEEIMKQDAGRVLPKRVFIPLPLLRVDSHDMNENRFCHSSSISPKCMCIQSEHNLECEQQV